ncbi:hypothetical protein MauCBS54593_001348 [Microsporum audouinii]
MAPRAHSYIYIRSTSQGIAGQRTLIIACSIAAIGVLLTVFIFLFGCIWRHHLKSPKFRSPSQLKLPRGVVEPSAEYNNTDQIYELPIQVIKPSPCILPLKLKESDIITPQIPVPAPRYLHPPNPTSFQNRSLSGFQYKRKCPPRLEPLPETGSITYTTVREFEQTPNRAFDMEQEKYDSKEFRGSLDELSTISNHLSLSTGPTRTVLAHTYPDNSHHLMDNAIPSPSLYFSASIDIESLMFPPEVDKPESCLLSRSRTKSSSVIILPGSSPDSKTNTSGSSKPLRATPSIISRWRKVRDMTDYQNEDVCTPECPTSPAWSEHCSVLSNLKIEEKIDE